MLLRESRENFQAGEDNASDVIAIFVDNGHRSSCSHVNDNNGAGIFFQRGNRVYNLIASHSLGIIHNNIQSGFHAGTYHQGTFS